jgi:hypothetical protein
MPLPKHLAKRVNLGSRLAQVVIAKPLHTLRDCFKVKTRESRGDVQR